MIFGDMAIPSLGDLLNNIYHENKTLRFNQFSLSPCPIWFSHEILSNQPKLLINSLYILNSISSFTTRN
jgi:hypothetical protein